MKRMAPLRSDIERALDDLISNEEGMRFQGLAVVLAKQKWPQFVACERKNDLGLDAHVNASLAPDGKGKGLVCSITATYDKLAADAEKAQEHFKDISVLIFVTPRKVSNPAKQKWAAKVGERFGYELEVISREDVISTLMAPGNSVLCQSQLRIHVEVEEPLAEVISRIRQAAHEVTERWMTRTRGHPLIDLGAVRLDTQRTESADVFRLGDIDAALREGRRVLLEAPAGRGKTTTLIQLARCHIEGAGTAFLIDLPALTASHLGILQFIAGTPSFQARSINAGELAKASNAEHFSFLLNGWNEIAESNSVQAVEALRELERDFPRAGIIVATRTHHIVPPLPGALRLRLLTLKRRQRLAYLVARLGGRADKLRSLLDNDPVLDELTQTPFILSAVTGIFEADEPIPTTKIGVLESVMALLEGSEEHRHHLQTAPLSACAPSYLGELAMEMTAQGAVVVSEAEGRRVCAEVGDGLRDSGQIASVPEPAAVLGTLCAHHVLERVEHPVLAFRFEHQQFQEFYAAHRISQRLGELLDPGREAERHHFVATYVNQPVWAEPFRMVAEEIAAQSGGASPEGTALAAGRLLLEMVLSVDLLFAAELALLCGLSVWREVCGVLAARLRSWYAVPDEHHRRCALAGMLASGCDEFRDIIVPLLSSDDQQVRLQTYRLWPDFHLSSLGPEWPQIVQAWGEEARVDFVSELLHNRLVPEVGSFALADPSAKVQKAAVDGLTWVGAEDEAARILSEVAEDHFAQIIETLSPDLIPQQHRPRALVAFQRLCDNAANPARRLGVLLKMAELGASDIPTGLKAALSALSAGEVKEMSQFLVRPALDILRHGEPEWASRWVAERVVEGSLWPDRWMILVTTVPDDVTERSLQRLETEDLKHRGFSGLISVIGASASPELAKRVFSKLCKLRRTILSAPDERSELEWVIERQLETLYKAFPCDIAISGLAAILSGDVDPVHVEVITRLFSQVGRGESEALTGLSHDLKRELRAYLKRSVPVVLGLDDFDGKLKANLACALAQVGEPEDVADLRVLIRADIERVRKGWAAWIRGDRSTLGNGAMMSYANWHVQAVIQLDAARAVTLLIELLNEPEYERAVSEEVSRLARLKDGQTPWIPALDYRFVWEARAGSARSAFDEERRRRYAEALRDRIARLSEERGDAERSRAQDRRLKELAKTLAHVDPRGSADLVLEVVSRPGEWDDWQRVESAERLLFGGVVLPARPTLDLLDPTFERARACGLQDQERWLVKRFLCICAFVDPPEQGIQKIREILGRQRLPAYELRDVVTALGQSRCGDALELLREFASDQQLLEQLDDAWTEAVAAIGGPCARDVLLSFVDPALESVPGEPQLGRQDVLAARVAELARADDAVRARLLKLCSAELPASKRLLLARVIGWLGSSEAIVAGLNLIDDAAQPPVPWELWERVETLFIDRVPYGQSDNTFTLAARPANSIRAKLFEMATGDERRKKSAFSLLGQIEEWRLEHGRPAGEPRHPALESGEPWPLAERRA